MATNDERIWIDGHMYDKSALIWNQEPTPTIKFSKEQTVWWDVDKFDIVSLEQGKLVLRRKDDEHDS